MEKWLILAAVIAIVAPFAVYGLVKVGSVAYFRTKREHTRSLLKELSGDDEPTTKERKTCH